MKETKIYIIEGYSREPYSNFNFILDAFISKELAEKVVNGFEDTEDYLIELWNIKELEREKELSEIVDLLDKQLDKQLSIIYSKYEQYEVYDSYYYDVKEISLID